MDEKCPAPGRPKPDGAPRGQERSDWGAVNPSADLALLPGVQQGLVGDRFALPGKMARS